MSKEWLKINDIAVGVIMDNTYYTFRNAETFMRKYRGFGLSSKIVSELWKRGINKICFIYDGKREKSIFTTTLSKIITLAITDYDYTFGFPDKQYFILIDEMEKQVLSEKEFENLVKKIKG